MRDLARERDQWHMSYRRGGCNIPMLDIYRQRRLDSNWSTNKTVEKLCEYIIYLESTIHRSAWTVTQEKTLSRIYGDKGMTISEIGRAVGHTESSVYQKARQLGLKRGSDGSV